MAVVLKNAVFLHVPKTGGEWARQVLWDAGLEHIRLHPGEQKHADLAWFKEHPEYDRPFRFAFVRHPLSWYRSFWKYQSDLEWRHIPEIDLCPPKPMGYADFLRWVVDERPGFLGRLYERYTGPFNEMGSWGGGALAAVLDEQGRLVKRHGCQFIGRTERLLFDLAWALSSCEETDVPWRLLATTPMQNVSGSWRETPAGLAERVLRSEQEVCQRFSYA